MSREVPSSRFISRNVVEASENEFESFLTPAHFPPSRTPFNAITDPFQYRKDAQDQETEFDLKGKTESARVQQHRLHDRRVEATDRLGSLNFTNATPRLANRHGKTSSEPNSAQSTPARSGSRVSLGGGPHAASRAPQVIGVKSGLSSSYSSRVSRGIYMIDNPDASVQVPHFELVEDSSFWADHNVQVLIRIRPLSTTEKVSQGYYRCLRQESARTLLWLGHPETRFTFDHIASETISQEKLFRVAGLPMVENCMSGYNSSMFAYGQTGSGKTYTMMGQINPVEGKLNVECGITPRIFEYLFQRIKMEEQSRRHEKLRFCCKCSFLEIYNEQITDLLEPSSTSLQLREDLKKGVYVENLTESNVQTADDILKLLLQGAANRKIAATDMNSESSRSHSVLTCIIESQWEKDSMTHLRFARLNLVDLAGSERQKSSGAEGDRLKEAANINKSLSTLGLVIMSLVDLAQGKHRHVPYRDSRLTFLLQDSLGGNSKTMIIANVSPSICAANETLSTLKFAQRAKLIQNNAKVNEDSSGDVTALQRQIQKLKDQLSSLMKHYHVLSSPKVAPGIDEYKGCGNADNNEHHLENLVDDFEMPCIQNKKMQRMKATLLGALRREKKAENLIHKLEAEIGQMNHLIRQREEDAQCIKMMQRFREEKIKKLESLVTKEISTEKVLIAEIGALKEENQMLQAKIDKNPELTRFALENTRLLEQLQLFQEFYQEGERETLLSEVEELREQLLGVLDEKNIDAKYENQGNDTLKELIECKNMNSKLMREVDGLHAELNKYLTSDSATDSLLSELNQFRQRGAYSLVTSPIHSNSEDEMDFHTPEAEVALEKLKEQKVCSVAVSESRESGKELMDAKLLVSAMEAEQMNLINELQRLRMENEKYVELLDEKEKLASECAPNCRSPCTESQLDKQSKGPSTERNDIDIKALQSKLNSLTDDLENTRMLNQKYKMDHLSYLSCQQQADLVREQVELETSSTIIHLQEEITALQIEINDKISSMADENVKLKDTIATQEKEINIISMEWEKATLDLTGFLIDGSRSLRNASHQIENIASSFPTLNSNIVDHVERAAKVCIDKEEKILALEKSLEDAQKMVVEMDLKLYSLKEAVLAFAEYWQSSSNEPAEVVAELCSYLNENIRIQMPDHQCEFNHNQIPEAENGNNAELEAVKCISDCNKVDLQNNVKRNVPRVKPAASARLSYPICETEGKITTPVEDVTSQLELAKLTVLEAQTAINASYADIEALFSTLQTCTLEPCLAYRELVQDFVREIYEMKIKFLELKGNCNDFGFCVNKLLSLSAFNMMRCQMLCQIKQKLKVTNSTLNTIKDLISIHFEVQTEMDRQSSVSSSSSSISSDSYASPNNLSGSCCSRKVMVTEDMVDKNYQEDPVDDKEFDGQFLERRVLDEAGTHCLRKELMKAFDAFCILYVELNNLLVRKYVQDCSYSEEMKQVIPPVGLTGDSLVPDEAGSCNRGVLSNNRTNHSKNFFQRFEEVHATVEEADYMLNTLVNENGSTKALNNSWRRANEELLVEKASLIKEVEQLRNLIHLKEGENVALHDQLHDTVADMANSMSFLEGSFLKMQKEVDENFEILRSGVLSVGQELLSSFPDLRKSLEDTCAMVLENEFVSFATYQCQVGDTARGNSILNVVGGSHSSRQQEHPSTIKSFQKSHSIEQQDLVVCSMDGAEESGSEKFRSLKDQIDLPLNWLINENCLLKKELKRKEVLLEGLLFDLHLLQESASETKDFKDESEKLILAIRQTRHELEEKTKQVDDLLLQHKKLESNLVDAQNAVYASTSNLEQAKEEIDSLREENAEMRMLLKELHIKKTEAEEQLDEQREVIKGLETEVLSSSSLKNDFPFSVEGSDDLRKIISERDHLQEEICSLTHKLEMAHALADEKEATAVEALQMSEASKLYAEQKEDEVKILEHSVEELERTVNMLEKKVYEMDEEVERHRAIRYSLEHELEGLRGRLSTVGHLNSSLVPTSRNNEQTEDQTSRSLEVQEPSMRVLQEERAELRREIETYKEYISEVVLHSEAQASQYQQKYKVLEAMFQEVKKDASNTSVVASENKIDRSSTRTRGSSSPFRCISSLVQQMNQEKDQELSNARLRIVELETLAASRQQEVCMLNTRLAAAESMTHDIIRDLLGVKLDMTNYANIVDQRQIPKLVEEAHQQADEFLAKEQEILKLKKQINDLSKERESCILEINKRDAELLGAKVSVQQLKERDLLLSAHNEMLKKDKNDLIKVVAELEEIIGNAQGTKINQKQVHPTSKTREASPLQVGDVNFGRRCQQSQKLLSRVNDELAMYYMNNRARPHAGASAKGSDTKYRIKKG